MPVARFNRFSDVIEPLHSDKPTMVCPAEGFPRLVDASPVTDRIVALRISEGYVDHAGIGRSWLDDVVHVNPLDVDRAADPSAYRIVSHDDPDFRDGASPVRVGRKSKAADFSGGWPPVQPYVSDHWIYCVLHTPMKNGASYRFEVRDPGLTPSSMVLAFDDRRTRSETVHVNQVGYAPQSRMKFAYVSAWLGDLGPLSLDEYDGAPFRLLADGTGEPAFEGRLRVRKRLSTGGPDSDKNEGPYGNFAGTDIWECDFSAFAKPGRYVVSVERIGCSFPFEIHDDVYRRAFHAVMKGLYHQRSGIALTWPFTGFERGRDHHPDDGKTVIVSDWRFMDRSNAFEELPLHANGHRLHAWGGWHDAGDWDRYHEHLDVSSLLLLAFELSPGKFADDELNIPESGNGVPDIIDEARWCIDFFKRLQDHDGGIRGGVEATSHPLAGESSLNDSLQWYAYGPDPQASYHFAACACALAHCLRWLDRSREARPYIHAAERAYAWATGHMREGDEALCRDLRLYASAWLFKVTGADAYHARFTADLQVKSEDADLAYCGYDQQWGVWTYVTTDRPDIDRHLRDILTRATVRWAEQEYVRTADCRGFRVGYHWKMPTLIGAATTPRTAPLMVAHYLTGDRRFLDCQYATCDYFLGGNPLNMTWVTGLGGRSPREMMHLDSWYLHADKGLVSGLVPYGPYYNANASFDGPWDPWFAHQTVYPDWRQWPSHELWFENRYCPLTNEFTVHQTIGPAAASYAYLCAALK